MKDPDPSGADRLARHVLTSRLQRGENVTVEMFPTTLPWTMGLVGGARRLEARPVLHYEDEGAYWAAIDEGEAGTLGTPGSHEGASLVETDVSIDFWGPEGRARLGQLPAPFFEKVAVFNPKWYRVAGRSRVRGVRIGIARVTESKARRRTRE